MISFLQEGSARSSTISLKMTCIAPSSKLHSSWGASAAPAAEHTIMTASGEAQHEAGKKRHIALVPHEPVDTNRDMLFRREGGLVVAHHASLHLPPPSCPPEQPKRKRKSVENPLPPLSKYAKHHHVSGPARKRVLQHSDVREHNGKTVYVVQSLKKTKK